MEVQPHRGRPGDVRMAETACPGGARRLFLRCVVLNSRWNGCWPSEQNSSSGSVAQPSEQPKSVTAGQAMLLDLWTLRIYDFYRSTDKITEDTGLSLQCWFQSHSVCTEAAFSGAVTQKENSSHCLPHHHLEKQTGLMKHKLFKKETWVILKQVSF